MSSSTLCTSTDFYEAAVTKKNTSSDMQEEFDITKGIQDVRVFSSVSNLRRAVKVHAERLQNETSHNQYIGFVKVTSDAMKDIENDRQRGNIPKYTRFHYEEIDETLIIKLMPSTVHEYSHRQLSERTMIQIISTMGIDTDTLEPLGSARFKAPHSSKEADSCFLPESRNPKTDWPTLVFEAGVSESLTRLQVDARWWLSNSNDEVKIVILIAINTSVPSIVVQKWQMAKAEQRGVTTVIPQQTQELLITPNSLDGAPLILEFEKVFLRPPVAPEEDIVFTAPLLTKWATKVWRHC